ncbi:hypothetical protein PanWU01x14_054730 [Parasponia andersonii]|uniref:Uncharacterized protein n=1 Tax=Parasponia andersonii TaxID=3476 RepID=A0A2P5DKV9_PARAD|nr:hypothetical protein PanWU01x14_054730 [Parasponia andersonii]
MGNGKLASLKEGLLSKYFFVKGAKVETVIYNIIKTDNLRLIWFSIGFVSNIMHFLIDDRQ